MERGRANKNPAPNRKENSMENIKARIEEIENELWCIEMADRFTLAEKRKKEELERELAELRRKIRG